ncbi:MAG: YciI family protein [Geminicoccaceae bacterium]|nr:YciI family protein [Geminicoccaceae bacterium]
MPYVIITRDKPGSVDVRNDVRPVHLEYMTARLDKLLGAFAQVDDANTTVHGGVIVYDSEDRAEVEEFVANDPFTKAGLFESITISRCRKAFFNYQRLI